MASVRDLKDCRGTAKFDIVENRVLWLLHIDGGASKTCSH